MSDEVNKEDEQVKDQSEDSSSKGESDTSGNHPLASSNSGNRGISGTEQEQEGSDPVSSELSGGSSPNTEEGDSNGHASGNRPPPSSNSNDSGSSDTEEDEHGLDDTLLSDESSSESEGDGDIGAQFVEKYLSLEEHLADDLYKIWEDKEFEIKQKKYEVRKYLKSDDGIFKPEYKEFIERYRKVDVNKISILFLGMNPSYREDNAIPFNYLRGGERVVDVTREDPVKPEISGRAKFWKFVMTEFGTLDSFFESCVNRNFCPISFARSNHSSGKLGNISLEKLPDEIKKELAKKCRSFLEDFINLLPNSNLKIVTFGNYVSKQATKVVEEINNNRKGRQCISVPLEVPHPSARGYNYNEWVSSLMKHQNVIYDIRRKKIDDFMLPPMNVKSITVVPGIGRDYVEAFHRCHFEKAYQLIGMFIAKNKNTNDKFEEWLRTTFGMKRENTERCCDAIEKWVKRNLQVLC